MQFSSEFYCVPPSHSPLYCRAHYDLTVDEKLKKSEMAGRKIASSRRARRYSAPALTSLFASLLCATTSQLQEVVLHRQIEIVPIRRERTKRKWRTKKPNRIRDDSTCHNPLIRAESDAYDLQCKQSNQYPVHAKCNPKQKSTDRVIQSWYTRWRQLHFSHRLERVASAV